MSQNNVEIIERAYQAFARGDVPAVVEMFADRLEHFEVVTDASWKAPWHTTAKSRADVAAYFQILLGALEPQKFVWEHLAGGGDYVYATTQQQYSVRKNGKTLVLRSAVHRFKLAGGRIVGWQASEDTLHTRDVLEG